MTGLAGRARRDVRVRPRWAGRRQTDDRGDAAKFAAVPEGTWQETQLVVMPAWLMREPLNLALLGTGRVGTLEPVPTWQDSHAALVGMWLVGRPMIVKLAAGIAKLAAAAPWHCAQLLVMLGALAWMLVSVGIDV